MRGLNGMAAQPGWPGGVKKLRKENNFSLPVFYNSVVMRNIIKYPRIVPKPLIYWFTDTDIAKRFYQ